LHTCNNKMVLVLRLEGVFTSTIGSFPLDDTVDNRRKCIDDLINVGIDFPAYPQLTEMNRQFLDDLLDQNVGLVFENGEYRLSDEDIREPESVPGLDILLWTIQYLEEKGIRRRVRIKAPITGPFTLASSIRRGKGIFPFNTAVSNPRLVRQIADVVAMCCREASKYAEMIAIDEPILTLIVGSRAIIGYKEEDIIGIFNDLREACGERIVGTHICGRISPRLGNLLLKTDLDFLSHEFHDTPQNIEVYQPEELKKSEKILSVGCLSSSNAHVESVDEILDLMLRFKDYDDCIIFTPDCGFRKLSARNLSKEEAYIISIRKLKNMVEAARRFSSIG